MSETEIELPEGMTADEAVDVLREYGTTEEPAIVTTNKIDSLKESIDEVKAVFASALSEESPQSADALAKQDLDALTEPFRDEEGDIEVDTLTQNPETGDVSGSEEEDEPEGFSPDTLSREDVDTLTFKNRKRNAFAERKIDSKVDELESEMAEIAGVEDFDEIEMEAL